MESAVELVDLIQDRQISALETHAVLDRALAALERSRQLLEQTRPLVFVLDGPLQQEALQATCANDIAEADRAPPRG